MGQGTRADFPLESLYSVSFQVTFVVEVIEGLDPSLFDDVGTLDFEAQVVDSICDSGDVRRAGTDRLRVEVPAPCERFAEVYDTLDVQQFLYSIGPFSRGAVMTNSTLRGRLAAS